MGNPNFKRYEWAKDSQAAWNENYLQKFKFKKKGKPSNNNNLLFCQHFLKWFKSYFGSSISISRR